MGSFYSKNNNNQNRNNQNRNNQNRNNQNLNRNNYNSKNLYIQKKCVICDYNGNGDDPLLKMHSKHNVYNNHFVCIYCYKEIIDVNLDTLTSFDNNTKNINKYSLVHCEWCKTSSVDREVFKIYWKGKYNNHYMCYICINSKEERRKNFNNLNKSK